MKYYKDKNNEVFAYELDGSQDHLIGNKVLMTTAETQEHLNPLKTVEQTEHERKTKIMKQLETINVTTSNGNVFDANAQARLDISNAILASTFTNDVSIIWRLADNSEVNVTIDELKEALTLALVEYSKIKGIGI